MIADEPAKGSRILLGARRGSGGQEGGWVGWRDGLRAEGDEVGVVGGGEGVDGFGGGGGLLAEGCGFAARCGVEYGDAVGKGGGAGVAAGGGGGGGAADAVGEGGEEQEAAGGEGVAPGAGECACWRGVGRVRRTGLISCDLLGDDPGPWRGEYQVTNSRAERFRLSVPLRQLEHFDVGDLL